MRKLVLSALLTMTAVASAQGTIKVGVLAPMTGFAAADGKSVTTGIKIAADDINKAGGLNGKKIQLITYDDQGDPKQAVNFARRLIELDKVSFIIGGSYSGASVAASDVANTAKVPFIAAYAVAPAVTANKTFSFRMGLLGPVQGRVGAELAAKLKAKNVAILTIQNDFGQALESGFQERAKQLGINIAFKETYPAGNQNFTPLLARLRAKRPDVIYASGYYQEGSALVRQARALGITAPIIGQEGYDSPKFIELAGKAAQGTYITTTLDRSSAIPAVQNFLKTYKATAKADADMVAASGYSALQVMGLAINKAKSTDPEKVRTALLSLRNVETPVGKVFNWTEKGDAYKSATVQIVRNNAFKRFINITTPDVLKP